MMTEFKFLGELSLKLPQSSTRANMQHDFYRWEKKGSALESDKSIKIGF